MDDGVGELILMLLVLLVGTWVMIVFSLGPQIKVLEKNISVYEAILLENDLLKRCVNDVDKTFTFVETDDVCP